MKAPKLLPWIARKAGIDDALALKLWRRAAGESERLTRSSASAEYYAAALSRFIDLVNDESNVACTTPATGTPSGWMWRHRKHMSQLNSFAVQDIRRLWQSNWGNLLASQKTSA